MVHSKPAVHRTILVVDVERFGDRRRTNSDQVAVRAGLYRAVQSAFETVGLRWQDSYHEDRGDSVFVLAGPEMHKATFVETLPAALVDELNRYNAGTAAAEQRIRLRMALHAGELHFDEHGVTGASINHAFRLLDAPQLKQALKDSPGVLALIVSSWFFDEVVRHSPAAAPVTYRPVNVGVKETVTTAWISLPDHPYPPQKTPVPKQLLARPRSFTGRAKEMAELTRSLDEVLGHDGAMAISVIAGMGGIGKTWLALEWAHENIDRFPDGQLYVNLRGFDPSGDPVTPAVAVRRVLDALQKPDDPIPVDAEAQVDLYRNLVDGKRMLIVLDNARDSDQVKPLLPGSPTCTVLITSREQLSDLITNHEARPVPLRELDELDARELLAKRLGAERLADDPAAVDRLVKYCAGLPLALAIVAAHAVTHHDFPLSALVSELGETSVRLDAFSGAELSANLRAVLSWSYRALDEDAREVFRLLGLVPGPDIGRPAAGVLTGRLDGSVVGLLNKLESAHLVHQHLPDRYRMHDLIRLYAAEQAEAAGPERSETALRRLITYYVHATYAGERLLYPDRNNVNIGPAPREFPIPRFDGDAAVLKWFDAEHFCLLAAQDDAVKRQWHRLVWQLAWTMHGYLWRRGHLPEQLRTWDLGLKAAQELHDHALEGVASRLLGQACARDRRKMKATEHLLRALELARESGDLHGEARAHYDLTWVWQETDDIEALKHVDEALGLFQQLGNPVWEAEALSQRGWHQAQLGRYTEARVDCEKAFELFRGEHNRQGQAITLDYLGYIALHRHEYDQALPYLRRSLELCWDLGATYYEAATLDHLGQTLVALGQIDEARSVWQRALDLNRVQYRKADALRLEQQLAELDEPSLLR